VLASQILEISDDGRNDFISKRSESAIFGNLGASQPTLYSAPISQVRDRISLTFKRCYPVIVDGAAMRCLHQELGRRPTPTCFPGKVALP
jgi:hypothetical protein